MKSRFLSACAALAALAGFGGAAQAQPVKFGLCYLRRFFLVVELVGVTRPRFEGGCLPRIGTRYFDQSARASVDGYPYP